MSPEKLYCMKENAEPRRKGFHADCNVPETRGANAVPPRRGRALPLLAASAHLYNLLGTAAHHAAGTGWNLPENLSERTRHDGGRNLQVSAAAVSHRGRPDTGSR